MRGEAGNRDRSCGAGGNVASRECVNAFQRSEGSFGRREIGEGAMAYEAKTKATDADVDAFIAGSAKPADGRPITRRPTAGGPAP